MKTFLETIAADMLGKYGTDLSRVAVIFPNKRASLFLNEYFARLAGRPLWSPAYFTISEFFCQQSSWIVADPIKLVCDLYRSFVSVTGSNETLDHFYSWGQLMIADFDDIDKNMADAEHLFANVSDLHDLDDLSYLSPQQKEMLAQFFANFHDDETTELKSRFIRLWSQFYDIYTDFKQRLKSQNIAYEGMLYRDVVEKNNMQLQYNVYLFVGFNLLQTVEKKLFQQIKQQGKARFYWDFDQYYMTNNHEAGSFIRSYLSIFPNELDSNDRSIYGNIGGGRPLTYISASSDDMQARYISSWLTAKNNDISTDRLHAGQRTAIVMCDENLLLSVVHSLPPTNMPINVTTGFPLMGTTIASLVMRLIDFNMRPYWGEETKARMKRHPYANLVPDDMLLQKSSSSRQLVEWLLTIMKQLATSAEQRDEMTAESFFRMYQLLNRLNMLITSGDLEVDSYTLQRLIRQLIQSTTIPFHGEPIGGLQIMGVLETRNLDFQHVLVLSCNEGNMPKGINDSSFIPYNIRKAYGLTTSDHKAALYSYYFHRMIQRANDVTLLYNNSTDGGRTGEMSRFMLQLLAEGKAFKVRRLTLAPNQSIPSLMPHSVAKDSACMERLEEIVRERLYPSSINRYIRCQLLFYFTEVCGLKEPDHHEEGEIDSRTFGDIFHKAAQLLYEELCRNSNLVTHEMIEYAQKNSALIERVTDKAINENLFGNYPPNKIPPLNGMQQLNREVIVHYLRRLLSTDLQLTPFTIHGTEEKVKASLSIGGKEIKIQGIIDRLDEIVSSQTKKKIMRVVDYKTGGKQFDNNLKTVADVFDTNAIKLHSDYYLQAMLYSIIVSRNSKFSGLPVSPVLLFIQHTLAPDFDPTLKIGGHKILSIADYETEFLQHFEALIHQILNPEIEFQPTAIRERCDSCPFRQLCWQ